MALTTGDMEEFALSSSLAGNSTILNRGEAGPIVLSDSDTTFFLRMTLPPVSAPPIRELSESFEQSEVLRLTILAPVAGYYIWKVY